MATGQLHPDPDFCLPNTALLTSIETARVMGFATTAALARARKEGRLPFTMFRVSGRRGWFAWREDVKVWLEALADGHRANQKSAMRLGANG